MPRPLAGFVASRGEVVKPFAEADRAMQEERVGRSEIKHVKYGKTNEYLHPEATGPIRCASHANVGANRI